MCFAKPIRSSEIFPMVLRILQSGGRARIQVAGNSMYPLLRDKTDSVELAALDFSSMRMCDIVLAVYPNGKYVLHRVIRKKPSAFYIVGDNETYIEGPFPPSRLLAGVTAIWRDGKRIACSGARWRAISFFWLCLFPFHHGINRLLQALAVRFHIAALLPESGCESGKVKGTV